METSPLARVQNPNIITGNPLGSPHNPMANFAMGVLTGYSENNSSPIADTAYQATAFFVDRYLEGQPAPDPGAGRARGAHRPLV